MFWWPQHLERPGPVVFVFAHSGIIIIVTTFPEGKGSANITPRARNAIKKKETEKED